MASIKWTTEDVLNEFKKAMEEATPVDKNRVWNDLLRRIQTRGEDKEIGAMDPDFRRDG